MSNRIIKFRAWDGKRMTTSGIMFNSSIGEVESAAGMPVMQYTGIIDKNGAEIYEGDIIQGSVRASGDYAKYVVEWDKTYSSFICGFIKRVSFGCETHNHPLGELRFDCEVIGNIHENPELLEQP